MQIWTLSISPTTSSQKQSISSWQKLTNNLLILQVKYNHLLEDQTHTPPTNSPTPGMQDYPQFLTPSFALQLCSFPRLTSDENKHFCVFECFCLTFPTFVLEWDKKENIFWLVNAVHSTPLMDNIYNIRFLPFSLIPTFSF